MHDALRRIRVSLLAALTMTVPALAATAGPVFADCAPAPLLEEAVRSNEVVFVGTVSALAGKGAWATVQVTEVWRGPDMDAQVTVRGSGGPDDFGEDDRMFEVGVTYLFVPWIVDGAYVESICTATVQWARAADALRPADWRPPSGSPASPGGMASPLDGFHGPVVAAAGLGLVFLVVAFIAGRRRDA
jgi:hypothetical protein